METSAKDFGLAVGA